MKAYRRLLFGISMLVVLPMLVGCGNYLADGIDGAKLVKAFDIREGPPETSVGSEGAITLGIYGSELDSNSFAYSTLSDQDWDWYRLVDMRKGTTYTVTLEGPANADFDLYTWKDGDFSKWSISDTSYETITDTTGDYTWVNVSSYSGSGSYTVRVTAGFARIVQQWYLGDTIRQRINSGDYIAIQSVRLSEIVNTASWATWAVCGVLTAGTSCWLAGGALHLIADMIRSGSIPDTTYTIYQLVQGGNPVQSAIGPLTVLLVAN